MKILLLSFYFQPDLSAGSFRATALVESLRGRLDPGSTIDVITTLPNRYRSFSAEAPERECGNGVSVTRIALPPHRSGMLDQSKAFGQYARRATRAAGAQYDVVVATSSRLMTAVLGAWVARRTGASLYLDLRDIFVDTIGDVASAPVAWMAKPVFSMLERWAIGRADKVNLVSRGFASYFSARYPRKQFTYFTNGIDDDFLAAGGGAAAEEPSAVGAAGARSDLLTVLYAGNVGEGQGLHLVLPALARRVGTRVRFVIIGDGGRTQALRSALDAAGVTNVELHPPIPRSELIQRYLAADVLFLHLNDYPAFEKVLPSKIFEYAAMGKPIWAGAAGYAADFLKSEVENVAVFRPCDVDAAVTSFGRLKMESVPRHGFLARYSRASLSGELAADILSLSPGAP